MTKSIFIKNNKRLEPKEPHQIWIPEHERLNRSPIVHDVSKDFMNEKIRKSVVSKGEPVPRTPLAKQYENDLPPVIGSKRTRAINPAHQEQTWLPSDKLQLEKDYSHGDIEYDDVPSPPLPEYEPSNSDSGKVSWETIPLGQYCLIYEGEMWTSSSLEEIEEAVEHIMRTDINVKNEELIIIKRLSFKVGVSVDR